MESNEITEKKDSVDYYDMYTLTEETMEVSSEEYQQQIYSRDDRNGNGNKKYEKPGKCEPYQPYMKVHKLATAYVPYQNMCEIYSPLKSLEKGTVFPELYQPYEKRCKKEMLYDNYKNPCMN